MWQLRFIFDGSVHLRLCYTLAQAETLASQTACDCWSIFRQEGSSIAGSGLYRVPSWKLVKTSGDSK